MLGKPAAFQHIAKLLLAPAAARLGRVAQRVDQLGCLAAYRFLPDPHLLDLAAQFAEGIAALRLHLLHALFITLQPLAHRLQHGTQVLTGRLFGLAETLIRTLKKPILRLRQQLLADLAELRRQRILRLTQFDQPRVERARLGLQARDLGTAGITIVTDRRQFLAQRIRRLGALFGAGKINDRLLEFVGPRIALGTKCRHAAAGEPPSRREPDEQGDDDQQCGDWLHASSGRERSANLTLGLRRGKRDQAAFLRAFASFFSSMSRFRRVI